MLRPPAEKMFEFRRNRKGTAGERSHAIRRDIQEAVHETREAYPSVAGFTMFGSRTKGREKKYSDIDIVIHLDDRLEKDNQNFPPEPPELFFKETMTRLLADSFSTTDAQKIMEKSHIYVHMLNRASIKEDIKKSLQYLSSSRVDREKADQDAREAHKRVVNPVGGLTGLFFLSVGHGLRPWRRSVIEQLEQAGSNGEKLWRQMALSLENWHEDYGGHLGSLWAIAKRPLADDVVPMTLEAARKKYHIPRTLKVEQKAA